MKIVRLYYDKDAEEAWLNAMARDGWAFRHFFLGVYTFAPCSPGEFSYQIDLLDNWRGDKEAYALFMEEVGVQVVGQWWRWVYLQKKAAEGPFALYTDTESKLSHYTKIRNFFLLFFCIELLCFFVEIAAFLTEPRPLFGFFTLLIGAFAFALGSVALKSGCKVKALKQEQ